MKAQLEAIADTVLGPGFISYDGETKKNSVDRKFISINYLKR